MGKGSGGHALTLGATRTSPAHAHRAESKENHGH